MLAMDGRCKTLDGAADGYARAEACGLMQLEQLDAWDGSNVSVDGPKPLGVLAGTSVNQVSCCCSY